MKFTFSLILILLGLNFQVKAEYNIVDNSSGLTFIEQGYRNVLNSLFLFVDNDKNKINIPYRDFSISLNPVLDNDNKIKGKDYYFTNYNFSIILGEKSYNLPFIILDASAIGSSILFNDINITIFSIESYTNPVSNNDSKKFKSDIYILNKKI